ncbi:hypothetical protein OKW41_004073 [Paraburkholderia sp. UCT70]
MTMVGTEAGSTIIITGTMTNNLALHPIRDIAALC